MRQVVESSERPFKDASIEDLSARSAENEGIIVAGAMLAIIGIPGIVGGINIDELAPKTFLTGGGLSFTVLGIGLIYDMVADNVKIQQERFLRKLFSSGEIMPASPQPIGPPLMGQGAVRGGLSTEQLRRMAIEAPRRMRR